MKTLERTANLLPDYLQIWFKENKLSIKYNPKSKIFDIKAGRISVLDNFVNIDLHFS